MEFADKFSTIQELDSVMRDVCPNFEWQACDANSPMWCGAELHAPAPSPSLGKERIDR
jgi:hypothetical protein